MRSARKSRAFSLLEVVIVVAIIAILAAIAIPRMSRGSRGANDSALSANLAVLRRAIDFYATEHAGTFPTENDIADQLTQYTDIWGDFQPTSDSTHIYGPYLRSIPPVPVGLRKGATGISNSAGVTIGWIYGEDTGAIRSNTLPAETDDTGKKYSDY